jgi:hypothetical protein
MEGEPKKQEPAPGRSSSEIPLDKEAPEKKDPIKGES